MLIYTSYKVKHKTKKLTTILATQRQVGDLCETQCANKRYNSQNRQVNAINFTCYNFCVYNLHLLCMYCRYCIYYVPKKTVMHSSYNFVVCNCGELMSE